MGKHLSKRKEKEAPLEGVSDCQDKGDYESQRELVAYKSMKHKLETTAQFFEKIEQEMSYIYRFEHIPQGRKLELVKFNAKIDKVSIREFLGDSFTTEEPFEVLIVRSCFLGQEQMAELN